MSTGPRLTAFCRTDFHCCRPILIAVEPSKLKMWEGEWSFWGAAGMHVISYTGSAAARAAIHDYQMFLAPGCLDGKAPKRIKDDIAAKVCMCYACGHLLFSDQIFVYLNKQHCC